MKFHDIGADVIGAFFAIKAVITVDVSIFISVQSTAPFVVGMKKTLGGDG